MKKADIQVGKVYGITSKTKWRGWGLGSVKKAEVVAVGQIAETWSKQQWADRDDTSIVRGDRWNTKADIVVRYEGSDLLWAVRPADVKASWEGIEALKVEHAEQVVRDRAAREAAQQKHQQEYEEWKQAAAEFNAALDAAEINGARALPTAVGTVRTSPYFLRLLTNLLADYKVEVAA
jgi:hypothetical protein